MNSDHTHVRSLLLEQLESRSLLAAGFFSWSGSHPDPHLNGHVHSHPDSLFRGDRIVHAGERHNQRPVEVIRQVSLAPLLEIRIIQRPVVVQVRTSPQVTVSAIQQTPMITPDKPPKSPERLTSSVDTAIRQDDELGVPDRSVGDTQDQSIREIPAKPSSSALRSSGTFTAADDASEIDVPPVISNAASEMHRLDPLSTPELRSPSLSDSIELGPPQHQREAPAHDSSEDTSWELDIKSIRRLREIINTPNTGPAGRSDGEIDQAIADWFGGPGGFIEILREGSVLPMPESLTGVVEIPIDVIVGSHRRLEISSANHSSNHNHQTRDAVLAALAGEQAAHAAPLHEIAPTRMNRLLGSATVLAASTLLIANRRKQKNAWCNTTAGNTPSQRGR